MQLASVQTPQIVRLVDVIIPALNEERAIGKVLRDIPAGTVRRVVVADNGSTDRTVQVAREAGAVVVSEPERGYGAACLKAMEYIKQDPPDVVVFLDGDYSDYPEQITELVKPIDQGNAELVIGSRSLGRREPGAITVQQVVGNAIACGALRWLYDADYTDLGPFRAILWSALEELKMRDRNYGWTVEMQIKAARLGLRHMEIPVRYRNRIGKSKVSGTIRGTLGASRKILWTLARYARN